MPFNYTCTNSQEKMVKRNQDPDAVCPHCCFLISQYKCLSYAASVFPFIKYYPQKNLSKIKKKTTYN